MLTGVTITGADDHIDPRELVMLSDEFPFVEFGILMSEWRAGTPRYPTRDWMLRLDDLAKHCARTNDRDVKPMNLSAHFCGAVARDALVNRLHPFPVIERFQRIQINCGDTVSLHRVVAFGKAMPCYEIIIQYTGRERDLFIDMFAVEAIGHASILFDASGGAGLRPDRWPPRPRGISVGYAGGIGPENVESVLQELTSKRDEHEFWIDMESGVRTGDRFDLKRVRQVLEQAWPFVGAA